MFTSAETTLNENLLPSKKNKDGKKGSRPDADEIAALPRSVFRKFLKYLLYSLIGIFSFLIFLVEKLPTDRIGPVILNYLNANTPYEWKADHVDVGILMGPRISFEKLQLTAKAFGAPKNPITLDVLSIRPSILDMIPIPGLKEFAPAASFSLQAYQGEASGSFKMGANLALDLTAQNMTLEKISYLKQAFDLDIKGKINSFKMQLMLPQNHLSRGDGIISIQGMISQFDPSSIAANMPIPNLELGNMQFIAGIKSGKLSIDRFAVGDSNKDIEAFAEGTINLREPIDFSEMDIKLKFKPSTKVMQAVPFIDSLFSAGKRPDGFYGLKLSGQIANPSMPIPFVGN